MGVGRVLKRLRVLMAPQEIEPDRLAGSTVVVVDIFLATTLLTVLENGARNVFPVASLEEAEEVVGKLDPSRVLRSGEQNAKAIEGCTWARRRSRDGTRFRRALQRPSGRGPQAEPDGTLAFCQRPCGDVGASDLIVEVADGQLREIGEPNIKPHEAENGLMLDSNIVPKEE